MKTLTMASIAACALLADVEHATAGGQENSLGVGAEVSLRGRVGGLSANYDLGVLHVGGFLGLSEGGGEDDTDYTLGARGYYHVHSTAMADFGVGGGFALYSADGQERDDRLFIEPGFQIRLFVASNVALSFTGGLSIAMLEADGFTLGGQGVGARLGDEEIGFNLVTGAAGVHYYFF